MTTADPTTALDPGQMTRAQRAALPISADVAQVLAEQHGVCIQPLAMRRIEITTGRVDIVPVPCGSTRADQCRPCAEKARRLRMAQCRQGWHLDTEPVTDRATPSEEHTELMAARADLIAAYTECKTNGDEITCEQIADSVAELDTELRGDGVPASTQVCVRKANSARPTGIDTPTACWGDRQPDPGALISQSRRWPQWGL